MTETETLSLIPDTLTQPLDIKGYSLGQKLTTLYADKAIIQGESYSFELPQFVEGGHCTAHLRPEMFHQIVVSYDGFRKGLNEGAVNAWFEVEWQEQALQVILVSWSDGSCIGGHYWIVADTEADAKEFYRQVCVWASEVRGEVLVFDNGDWHKDEMLYHAIQNATFANLILPPRLKQEIQDDFAAFLASRELYEQYRIPWKRGVLLIGPPGNGKTHTVKALINSLGVPCLYVKSFKHRYSTEQRNIHAVFQRARQSTPCILVMEDLDSLITDQNRSFFLNELDGFAANTGIVVLATTNHPDRLDPALVNRPSRFDRKYYFELPAETERCGYIQAWNGTMEWEMRLSEPAIAATVAATEGFSFAYLKELFLSAIMRWISSPERLPMERVIAEQCGLLREQMHAMNEVPPSETQSDEDDDD